VLGIGGLGHLGVQFSSRAGFETVAVSRQESKLEDASEMGAEYLVNSSQSNISDRLEEIGGADLVLSTAPSRKAMEETIQGLAVEGEMKVLGLPGTQIEVSPQHLVQKNASVSGHSSGRPIDAEKTLKFAQRNNVEPEIEVFDLSEYEKAYRKMMDGEVRYRAVLEP
jgi:NADPH2:quinone reductase